MSRTIRRQKGERKWAKLTPRYVEYADGVRLAKICINWHEVREYGSRSWLYSWKKPNPTLKYAIRWSWARFYPITHPNPPAEDVLYDRLRNECDWSSCKAKATYKELVNTSDRACRRRELGKIMKSARGNLANLDFDDVYDYDDSYENSVQRALIWCVF